jgi:hypothetical protein
MHASSRNYTKLSILRRVLLECLSYAFVAIPVTLSLALVAQNGTEAINATQLDRYDKKTYVEQNGTQQLTRTLETEHRSTSDGDVEIQRYRAPAWEGDASVSWEREVRTRKLPNGVVEREFVLRNPDGDGKLAPIQIIREKTTPGADSTVVHREVLQRLGGSDLQVVQKEQVTEKGSDEARQVFKEVQRLDTTHQWQTVERETSLTGTSKAGNTTQQETKSVIQTPDAFRRMADFERRQERTVSSPGKETNESIVYRRDDVTLGSNQFFLFDHTTSEILTTAPGTTVRRVVRESERNMYSRHPEIVEEQTTVEKTAPDGSQHTVMKVSERTASDPSVIRPVYTIIENLDRDGHVRRIYIPAQ